MGAFRPDDFSFDARPVPRRPGRIHPPRPASPGLIDRLGACRPAALIVGAAMAMIPLVAAIDWLRG